MTAETKAYAVTANRLRDGSVIYFAGNGAWSNHIADAAISADGEALLAEAVAGPLPLEAVGSYVIEVSLAEGTIRPIGLREDIRATGPTA